MTAVNDITEVPEGVDPTAALVADLAREAEASLLKKTGLQREGLVLLSDGVGRPPKIVDLAETYGLKPVAHRGTVKVATVDALLAYLGQHEGDGTTVWVHPTSGRVEAVIDDHTHDEPGNGEHRAVLQLDPSPAWKAWAGIDGRLLPQADFAEFIEDHLTDVQIPDAATLLEVTQTLTGKTEVEWKSAIRLSDGQVQAKYFETGDASAGLSGELEIPTAFVLALAPFRGEERVDVHGRLRWRIRNGTVAIGIRLDRPEDVVDAAIEKVRARLDENLKHVYVGSPR